MNLNLSKHLPAKRSGITAEQSIEHISRNCSKCGSCLRECSFLQHHGTPGRIAGRYLAGSFSLTDAFSCNLCSLCNEICPQGLQVSEMFLELRRRAVRKGQGGFREHLPLLWYEALGSSALSDYLLPAGCTTVFFPGCALPGIRPRETYLLFRLLQKQIPKLGLVFDCCRKPSHDLGLADRFLAKFAKMLKTMQDYGIKRIITACPSCLQIFRQYGEGVETETIYTRLTGYQFGRHKSDLRYTLHDPCTIRFAPEIHQAVRQLIESMGLSFTEMAHNRATTFCCGEGGAALCPNGGRDSDWRGKRLAEAGDKGLLTYCAGCALTLASARTYHLLDFLLASPEREERAPKPVMAPFTYLNRLYLKLQMKVAYLLGRLW